jgi:hypothetical protein
VGKEKMTEKQIREYLKEKGCPDSVQEGGSERLIQNWNSFVSEVEKGYCPSCLIDEYWNDLDTRELIHDVGLDGRVKEADERFRAILTATQIKHHHRERDSDYDFWNFGYPKNATGFFYEQVKCHILQQS